MNPILTFQEDVNPLLTELGSYIAQHPDVTLLCPVARPLPGLPMIPENAEHLYRNYRHYLQTPWGLATYTDIRYHQYPQLSYAGLYSLVEPKPDVVCPRPTVPERAVAVVQPLNGLTAVYAGDSLTAEMLATTPVWEGKLTLPDHWNELDVLALVRRELAQAGAPWYPGALYAERVAYPWLTPEGLPAQTAYIANGEVRLPVSGYVIEPDSQEVVYLSLVGHKTAARSIWGSLNTMHQRKLTLDAPGLHTTVISSHNYATYTASVDADTGLLRMQIVDRRALAADVEDRAYLVVPRGLDAAATDSAFAVRLGAVLPIGVPAQWGSQLREVGDDLGLVRPCLCGGDVGTAYALTADEQWLDLVAGLLRDDPAFVIPETL